METFSLPGFDVEQTLGFGGCGEVWRARERATGELVALKRLRFGEAAGDVAGERQLRREAALLGTVQHEHVVRLRATVPTASGLVLVLDYAEGGSLASLLAARGRLPAGEVVTMAAPLAAALAEVHARGVVHGDITPANVLFDGAGKPLLADLGVARLVEEAVGGLAATPGFADPAREAGASGLASDVHGLAAVCHAALTGAAPYRDGGVEPLRAAVSGVPPSLVAAIESAMSADFRARPDAAGFARALYAACTPQPVMLVRDTPPAVSESTQHTAAGAVRDRQGPRVGSQPDPRAAARRGGRHRGSGRPRCALASRALSRRLGLAFSSAALLAVAALVGVAWAAHERPAAASAQPAVAGPSSDASWLRVLAALDAARDRAFVDASPDELTGVYVAGSAALAADQRTLAEMSKAGQHARDLALELLSVEVRAQTPTSVELRVRDTLPPYELVGGDGTVESRPGRGERSWLVSLRAATTGGSWRIASIDTG